MKQDNEMWLNVAASFFRHRFYGGDSNIAEMVNVVIAAETALEWPEAAIAGYLAKKHKIVSVMGYFMQPRAQPCSWITR